MAGIKRIVISQCAPESTDLAWYNPEFKELRVFANGEWSLASGQGGDVIWGSISGNVADQVDLVNFISANCPKEITSVKTYGTAPSSASEGDYYINASESKLYKYIEGTWTEQSIVSDCLYITEDTATIYMYKNNQFVLVGGGDTSGKADKVASATQGDFAGLDSNGNLTDSGKKASDFAAASHTHSQYQTKITANYPFVLVEGSSSSALRLRTATPNGALSVLKGSSAIFPEQYRTFSYAQTSSLGSALKVVLQQLEEIDGYLNGTTAKTFILHNTSGSSSTVTFEQTGGDYSDYSVNPTILNMSGVSLPVIVPDDGYLVAEAYYCPETLSSPGKGTNPNASCWIITRIIVSED